MKTSMESGLLRATAVLVGILAVCGLAAGATQYVVASDDMVAPFPTGVSFYAVAPNGLLTLQQQVVTGGSGIGGGFFGANRISVLDSGNQGCVYASDAGNGGIVGIVVSTLTVGGRATGSVTDAGTSNGIGLAMNERYLYASFTDSNTIGTFQVQPGCSLAFVGDVSVAGLQDGIINGMKVHGNMLIATYTDGSIESFDISGGTPVSNGDKQNSTATLTSQGATYPNSIDITRDGHYAIFGDTSTSVVVEVSDISSGKLTATVVYKSTASISSSNIMLSPDENVLYVVNTQGDRVSAAFFNKTTGKLSGGCTSGRLRGLSENFSYLAGLALASPTGNGGGVYVAEFGSSSAIAMVKFSASGRNCSLREVPQSPVADLNSPGLLSIGTFPPRSF
ncbi:MAG: lactonase family protein [Acidobacteriia bacterium]|nr:lactonase family protein [Terriglobia bacterium]